MSVDELKAMPYNDLTDQQRRFLHYYDLCMPVGTGDCVMNRICRRFENEFDFFSTRTQGNAKFDYTIYKSGTPYTQRQMSAVRVLYEDYNKRVTNFKVAARSGATDADETVDKLSHMEEEFRRECSRGHTSSRSTWIALCQTKNSRGSL